MLAGLAGAWLPAREAARMIPARGLRAGDEAEVYRARPRWGAALLIALILAALLCLLPPVAGVPVSGYLAVALILIGAILALPGATVGAMRLLPARGSLVTRLARARLAAAPGQAVVAGVGVVASVALAVSMAIMVDSFRGSLDDWLTRMLPADLYLRASDSGASGYLDPETVARIAALPGVEAVRPVRFESLRIGAVREAIALIARPVQDTGGLPLVAGTLDPRRRARHGSADLDLGGHGRSAGPRGRRSARAAAGRPAADLSRRRHLARLRPSAGGGR